jgi:hypothetical protein
MHAAALRHF